MWKSFEKNWEIPILGKILKQIMLFLKYKLLFHCNVLSKAVALSEFPSDNEEWGFVCYLSVSHVSYLYFIEFKTRSSFSRLVFFNKYYQTSNMSIFLKRNWLCSISQFCYQDKGWFRLTISGIAIWISICHSISICHFHNTWTLLMQYPVAVWQYCRLFIAVSMFISMDKGYQLSNIGFLFLP